MSNIIKFPINKTRPSDDGDKRIKFNIRTVMASEEFKQWVKEISLNKKDLAAHYGSIYRKRFESDKTSGYEFLVQIMRPAKPTFGHIVLAGMKKRT